MKNNHKQELIKLLVATSELYSKELTPLAFELYTNALADYSIDDIRSAISKHVVCPKHGRFYPKPADIVAHCGKSQSEDELLNAIGRTQWASVLYAIRLCGSYETPKFKDQITVEAIQGLGGWVYVCSLTHDQLTWAGKRFEELYRDYSQTPLQHLTGKVKGRIEELRSGRKEGDLVGVNHINKGVA